MHSHRSLGFVERPHPVWWNQLLLNLFGREIRFVFAAEPADDMPGTVDNLDGNFARSGTEEIVNDCAIWRILRQGLIWLYRGIRPSATHDPPRRSRIE